ncbi:MAG: thymidine phosphorylase [Defluviitaleaceae bacterium]|nr:thymidine phosphorylase [Defluviitaleaceae bacterium]
MRMYDLINKKKRGGALTDEEIFFAVDGFTCGEIPDYQMSALLMAIYFKGMDARETAALTMAMVGAESAPKAGTIDKHSTGGVGDKTTLAVVPIVAACGVPVAKMSGRGLGHTGGTIDKLEAIPGFRTTFSASELDEIVQKHGLCIAGQSQDLAPADKKIYALRDATATVDSIPLIAASIMSKKIAAGAGAILLDVKTGNGAFMKSLDEARELARAMVEIGENCGRKTVAIISDMSAPLGRAIGNSLEIGEIFALLRGRAERAVNADSASHVSQIPHVSHTPHAPLEPDAILFCERLRILCEELAAHMLFLAGKGDIDTCLKMAQNAISSGAALEKFEAMLAAQRERAKRAVGTDDTFQRPPLPSKPDSVSGSSLHAKRAVGTDDTFQRPPLPSKPDSVSSLNLPRAAHIVTINSPQNGFIGGFDTEGIGIAAMLLGAGREKSDDKIDYAAGIILHATRGDRVKIGDPLAELHTSDDALIPAAREKFLDSLIFSQVKPQELPLIYEKIGV